MTLTIADRFHLASSSDRATAIVAALHVPFAIVAPAIAIPRHRPSLPASWLLVFAAIAMGIIHLRNSRAVAQNERSAAWAGWLLALAATIYVPMVWIGWDWAITQWFLISSIATLLPKPVAWVAAAAPIVVTAVVSAVYLSDYGARSDAIGTIYLSVLLVMGSAALYSSARLRGIVKQLDANRATLAQVAVDRERLRISRDLHDLLGHTLSAVSLKGDLAVRLLERHADDAARAEIESLTEIARTALHDIHAITRDQHAVSIRSEVAAAGALLRSAGIDTRIDVDIPACAKHVEETLAWAVREGTTNVLRHSDADHTSITITHADSLIRLRITNDGSSGASDTGTGLTGLAARAATLGGTATGQHTNSQFELRVEIPEHAQ
jgi:two-component system, NarL family, sensor histidine kinase DesK